MGLLPVPGGSPRPGAVGSLQGLGNHRRAAMRVQEHLNQACAVLQGVTQVSSSTITHLDDIAQGNGLSRSFRTNGPTEKALVMQDTDFGHIPWVIANNHGFPHVGRQREIEVAQALEMHAIGTHLATFRHGQ